MRYLWPTSLRESNRFCSDTVGRVGSNTVAGDGRLGELCGNADPAIFSCCRVKVAHGRGSERTSTRLAGKMLPVFSTMDADDVMTVQCVLMAVGSSMVGSDVSKKLEDMPESASASS
eukprot:scaffold318254_cov33-Tisochrysis_lutea.AAC.2